MAAEFMGLKAPAPSGSAGRCGGRPSRGGWAAMRSGRLEAVAFFVAASIGPARFRARSAELFLF